mmetsp:Transcript_8099/g.19584  ORF Transcript_8099/g.19584 Transcript_8099/m.19584 type:complete len:392 (+) Transcript_8099:340-1515(+)
MPAADRAESLPALAGAELGEDNDHQLEHRPYKLLEHIRSPRGGTRFRKPRHREIRQEPKRLNVKSSSAVWDTSAPTCSWVRGQNPRIKLFGPKPNPKLAQNLELIGDLRKMVDGNALRNTMSDLKQRSFLWQDEYKIANDVTQTLDFLVRHGIPAQKKSRKAHRSEGFRTVAEVKKEKDLAQSQPNYQSSQKHVKTTHTRVLHNLTDIRKEIVDACDSDSEDEYNGGYVGTGGGGGQTQTQTTTMASTTGAGGPGAASSSHGHPGDGSGESSSPSKRVSDRVAAPFGGYNLSMNMHRHHPLQDTLRKRDLDHFKNVQWRKQGASNLEEHILTRYCFQYSPYEDSRLWPSVRFREHAMRDAVLRKTDALPDSLFAPEDSASELEPRRPWTSA